MSLFVQVSKIKDSSIKVDFLMQYINVASVRSIESINFARKAKLWVRNEKESFSFFVEHKNFRQKSTNTIKKQRLWCEVACIIIKIVSTLSTILPFFFASSYARFCLLLFYGMYWQWQAAKPIYCCYNTFMFIQKTRWERKKKQ